MSQLLLSRNTHTVTQRYWFILQRKSNVELLYFGMPGDAEKSSLVKTFPVKVGIPGERPTPLPALLGRSYWIITHKNKVEDNPETAPYFLKLNIPYTEYEPFGPEPYMECNGQCNWVQPGEFGLHGIGDSETRLAEEDTGSSGCIRHTNEDITYLYTLLDLSQEVRYYVHDV